ncbi:cytoskeleton protein RodZ [Pseudomonas sp. SJZ079]|uniref:RodZ domain-containing protein n=1 Tax=Pseudomonas sp. SJZ079 TaxID=2572887 RepID=UPI00119946AD|nr:RodZ family helix-turn-helix domain-containing protein [Pseudomonas sp. SJZ079]TWC37050.1 cytoskeleton protein RodZ [Pseudomonas sp. SJZ079]
MKAAHPEVVTVQRVNPGESLREARESKNWTVAEAAERLNLTSQRLSQIEDGDFDKLPGSTFARGYIRAYAKLLELDQNRLVLEFDQFTGTDAAGSSVHSLGRIEQPASYSQRILRFISFTLLLGLVGAGLYWWQEHTERQTDESTATSIEHVEVEGADGTTQIHPLDEPEDQAVMAAQGGIELSLPSISAEPTAESETEVAQEQALADAPVQPQTSAGAAANDALADEPDSAVESAAVDSPAPAAEPVLAAGQGQVNVTFTADCWTQLTDANGKILFSALKRGGESLKIVGKAPLELRLGFARGAQVSYNGQAVDVSPFITGETARLKLGL